MLVATKRLDRNSRFRSSSGFRFDRSGHRLGHGQGFYDRLLSSCLDSTIKCGVCFESQLAEAIPHELHDVPMHQVITELAVYECKQRPPH